MYIINDGDMLNPNWYFRPVLKNMKTATYSHKMLPDIPTILLQNLWWKQIVSFIGQNIRKYTRIQYIYKYIYIYIYIHTYIQYFNSQNSTTSWLSPPCTNTGKYLRYYFVKSIVLLYCKDKSSWNQYWNQYINKDRTNIIYEINLCYCCNYQNTKLL